MRLRIALPVGRMESWAVGILRRAGMPVQFFDRRYRIRIKHELVAEILWAKPKEIPKLVYSLIVDAGLTGGDCCEEWIAALQRIQKSRFQNFHFQPIKPGEDSKEVFPHLPAAELWLIAKKGRKIDPDLFSEEGLQGKGCEVVTDFPSIVHLRFPRAKVIPFSGGIEGLVPEPYKYAVTLVETGKTLQKNDLALSKLLLKVYPVVCFHCANGELKQFIGLVNKFALY